VPHLQSPPSVLSLQANLSAQTGTAYRPSYENPRGREIVAVLVSSSKCIGNTVPGFLTAVDTMNRALAAQARRSGRQFVAVGVATDWDTDSGYAYLKSLTRFDEVIVGRNWFNLGASRYVWGDSAARPIEPQVILLERTITMGDSGVAIGPTRVLARYQGADKIIEWVKRGTPIP
jgi:hypothetical protein